MREKLKEIVRHSLVYGVGSALQALVGFILIPLYTKYYTTEIYGVLALLTLCSALAGAFFFLGGSSALSRSYYDHSNLAERRKAIGTSLMITLVGAAVQVLLGILLSRPMSVFLFGTQKYALHISIILGTSALVFTNNLFFLLLRFARKSARVVVINFVSFIIDVFLITYFLIHFRLGVLAPVLGDFCTQIILCGLLLWATCDDIGLACSRPELAAQLKYGIPTMLAGLAYYMLTWADRLLLNHFSTLGEVGIYSLGYRLGTSIQIMLIVPFCQIWAPMRMQYRNDPDAPQFYKRVLTYYFIIGLTITVCVGVFSNELLVILARRLDYRPAANVIALIMLAHLLYGSVNIIDCGIIFSRRTMLHVYIFGMCVPVNLLLNVVMISRYGAMGAAWAALATFFLLVLLVFVVSNRLFRIDVEFSRLAHVFLAASMVLLASRWISSISFFTIAVRSGMILAMLGFIFACVLSPMERAHLLRMAGVLKRQAG